VIQDREEPRKASGARGREERLDGVPGALTSEFRAFPAPCTRRRARLASCRAAIGERPTMRAISSNGTSKRSWSTKATRSVGASRSSTTRSAIPTPAAQTAILGMLDLLVSSVVAVLTMLVAVLGT